MQISHLDGYNAACLIDGEAPPACQGVIAPVGREPAGELTTAVILSHCNNINYLWLFEKWTTDQYFSNPLQILISNALEILLMERFA